MLINNILVHPDQIVKQSGKLPIANIPIQKPSLTQPSIQKDVLLYPENLFKNLPLPSFTKGGMVKFAGENKIIFNRHIHTCDHGKPQKCITLEAIRQRYNKSDFIAIENHTGFISEQEIINHPLSPTLLPGSELAIKTIIGTHGKVNHHIGVIGVDENEHKQLKIGIGDTAGELHEKVKKANGVMIFNHPEYPYISNNSSEKALDYILPYEDAINLDGIELFNDVGFGGGKVLNVLGWIERNFYERGLFPAVLSGQDDHADTVVSKKPTYNVALSENKTKTEADVINSIKNAKTYVSKNQDTDIKFKVDNFYTIGNKTTFSNNSEHVLDLKINNLPADSTVEVIYNGSVYYRQNVSNRTFNNTLKFPTTAGKDKQHGYVYIRVFDNKNKLHTITSAFSFKVI